MISCFKQAAGLVKNFSGATRTRQARFLNRTLLSEEQWEGMRVFATTVIRGTEDHELTGFLLEIDWRDNQIKEQIPLPLDTGHPFWNARGGNRGGRGVFVHNGSLYVATAMSVLVYDNGLNQIGELAHPYLAGLHEIYADSDGIWLTSTIHDLVVKLDFEGNILDEWWGSESQLLQKAFGFTGRDLDVSLDFEKETFAAEYQRYCKEERLHVNTVWVHDGEVYVLACRKKAFIRIRPEPERIVLQDKRLGSPHNGIVSEDGSVLINDTQNQCIRMYDLLSGKCLSTLSTPVYESKKSRQFAKAGWQRGLAWAKDWIYLVGTSPATIFEVDIETRLVGQVCQIDMDVSHCIHGLTAVWDF